MFSVIHSNAPLDLEHSYHRRTFFTKHRLFEVLEQHFVLVLDWGKRTFEAQSADAEIARLLEISLCDPVMNLDQYEEERTT